ncbi:hypothetical protein [Flavobacteriaceae bacterium 14752]|uniref:hypothetical protein n=1 Tax=Mesohalobacter salilacus TaxID=2491711 RepID=UPI000F63DCB8|nr:hypothetical protein EIG84_12170 [Flavobacteriaceae bacterium 14752]
MKRIQELNPSTNELLNLEYKFQPELTDKLDKNSSDFNQAIINEIVLWKTNRYAQLNKQTLDLINKIDKNSDVIDDSLTGEILMLLLETKGIRLPMASTILRFKNPKIYQIIDQRVYRLIYGTEFEFKTSLNDSIIQYLEYLDELKHVCELFQIPFSQSDRILYEYDKRMNSGKIKY